MKKRLVSLFMACCLTLTLAPGLLAGSALAVEEPIEKFAVQDVPAETPDPEPQEFSSGTVPEPFKLTYPEPKKGPRRAPSRPGVTIPSDIPESFDTRNYGWQTPVRNQHANGMCWAFGTYAAMEANLLVHNYGSQDLSEMHMGYSTSTYTYDGSRVNQDQGAGYDTITGGGNRFISASYLARGTSLSGAVNEADDPYVEDVEEAGYRSLEESQNKEKSFTAQNIVFISDEFKADANDVVNIKAAVMQYGGVGASMYSEMGTTADNASGGATYYNAGAAAYYMNEPSLSNDDYTSTNHLVEIAGWDDAFSKDNFVEGNQPSSDGAWLVKNSWGDDWGDGGYFWISYEDSNFPVSAFAFDGVQIADTSQKIYEYDYKSPLGSVGYSKAAENQFARVFTFSGSTTEYLQSVRVFLPMANTAVRVDVIPDYTDFDSETISNAGSLSATYPGWYTVDLDEPVALSPANDQFAVIVALSDTASPSEENAKYLSYDASGTAPANTAFLLNPETNKWDAENYNWSIKALVGTLSDEEAVNTATITWDQIRGTNLSMDQVKEDLLLPEYALNGAALEWESSRTDVISTSGAVFRQAASTTVTLTATAVRGSASAVAGTFELTVLRAPSTEEWNAIYAAAAELDWSQIGGYNESPDYVLTDLVLPASFTAESGQEYTVTWSSSRPGVVNPDTGMVYWEDINTPVSVTLTAVLQDDIATCQIEFALTVYGVIYGYVNESNEDVIWALEGYNGILTIAGTGAAALAVENNLLIVPWQQYYSDIWAVLIQDGITELGQQLFINCSNLEYVYLPDSITSMGAFAFSYSPKLKTAGPAGGMEEYNIEFAWQTSLPDLAFYSCTSLEEVTIPDGMETLGSQVFRACSGLREVHLPDSLTEITNTAFYDCTSLEEVTIPDGVKTLGYYSFANCAGLKTVYLPDSLTYIENNVFDGCTALAEVEYAGSENQWKKVGVYNANNGNDALLAAHMTYGSADITFAPGEGSGSMAAAVTPKGAFYTLPACDFTAPEGKRFAGWQFNDGGTFAAGSEITLSENTTMTAVWAELSAPTSTIHFNPGEGSGVMADWIISEGVIVALPAPTGTFTPPEGMQFKGWKIGESEYDRGDGYQFAEDTELTAIWELVDCKVSYYTYLDGNGWTSYAPDTVKYGDMLSPEQLEILESGYVLDGWYQDEACTTIFDADTPVTGDMNLYGVWLEEAISLSGSVKDGTLQYQIRGLDETDAWLIVTWYDDTDQMQGVKLVKDVTEKGSFSVEAAARYHLFLVDAETNAPLCQDLDADILSTEPE